MLSYCRANFMRATTAIMLGNESNEGMNPKISKDRD